VTSIGTHGLTCLDGSSYAAVALGMQANAKAINAALLSTQTALQVYGNRFVSKTVSTSVVSTAANSGLVLVDGTAAESIISKSLALLPQGWYSASGSLTYQESGAVTANSYRRSLLIVNSSAALIPPSFFQATTAASNTAAADSMTVNGWFYSNGVQSTRIQLMFGHGNAASSINVASGAVLTVRFLSTGLVT
jgi:hypothetical protein